NMFESYAVFIVNDTICQTVLFNTCLMLSSNNSFYKIECGDVEDIYINGIVYSNCFYTLYHDENCIQELYSNQIIRNLKCDNLQNSNVLFTADKVPILSLSMIQIIIIIIVITIILSCSTCTSIIIIFEVLIHYNKSKELSQENNE